MLLKSVDQNAVFGNSSIYALSIPRHDQLHVILAQIKQSPHEKLQNKYVFIIFIFQHKRKKSVRKQMVALHSSHALRCIRDKEEKKYVHYLSICCGNKFASKWMAYENKKKHIPNALLFACSNEKSIKKKNEFLRRYLQQRWQIKHPS